MAHLSRSFRERFVIVFRRWRARLATRSSSGLYVSPRDISARADSGTYISASSRRGARLLHVNGGEKRGIRF